MASAATPEHPVILHVDMDAFYAAVEIRENPQLEGKPVVVGADPRVFPRGVVLTASYDARRFGVRSAMPCREALRLCPDAVFVPPTFATYARVSAEIMTTLRTFADRLQPAGIEEAYLDVTQRTGGDFGRARDLARDLKAAVRTAHRLACSVGVAPSKAVAKIASGFEKPDGLTVVTPDAAVAFLAPISVREVLGVGPKTAERLKEIGLTTLAEVQGMPRDDLVEVFGGFGEYLHDVAFGRDSEQVVEPSGPPESVGTETTFDRDLDAYDAIWPELEAMARDLHREIREEGLAYRTVTLKARYANFETHTRSRSLKVHTSELDPILILSQVMLREVLGGGRKLRLVGVRVTNLRDRAEPQATLARWEALG
ncbi:MAG: DNA polymerase IV [Methanobacteriota archaeon]